MGRREIFSDELEPVARELRAYIEDWREIYMKKNDQRYRTCFLSKYGGISLYNIDLNKIYIIDHKYILFLKKYRYDLIGNPDNPDRTSMYHEYFSFVMNFLQNLFNKPEQ